MAVKVKVGDIVGSEHGIGKIVAITKQFVIHEVEDGEEYAIHIDDRGELFAPVEVEFAKVEFAKKEKK